MVGLVLAAGAGRRMGSPKALVADDGGPWLARAALLPLSAGCARVLAVLGAAAEEARQLLPADPRIVPVVAPAWASGMAASLRAGIEAAAAIEPAPNAVLVTLVDLPSLQEEAFRKVLAGPVDPGSLRRAEYGGRPGHPVLIGRDHWAPLLAELAGDRGAGPYLAAHGAEAVDCTGLGGDLDIDLPGPQTSRG
ncbi:NTP transferase domain-containing protein [Sinomonas sp. R1AF57]|uniref:nucleotidyltransferase family protein n=1 Tax=Sinomonas sp. R1AF57 TaxID=2020377 RepID=UPI000B60B90A|nr:nucleotidyltransferase family protein [Sinomonas sp. R1AF57]ASN51723.1 molybdopterin-guanine dinucleotide biosynthesis protein MobA [Sinomonas sp. R1AF57]